MSKNSIILTIGLHVLLLLVINNEHCYYTNAFTTSKITGIQRNVWCNIAKPDAIRHPFLTTSKRHAFSDKNLENLPDDSDESDDDPLDKLSNLDLGIDIGKEIKLTEEDAAAIKAEGTEVINEAFEKRVEEMEVLRKRMQKDLAKSQETMKVARDLKMKYETEKLMDKIDKISDKFLEENKELREGTKMAAEADKNMEGKGVVLGSWGNTDGGYAVGTGIRGTTLSSTDSLNVEDDDEWGEVISVKTQNKVLIIANEDETAQKLLPEVCNLLNDRSIQTETLSPLRPVPMGGCDSQTALIFAHSLNDRSSLSTILDRILTRTATVGKVSVPPSHIVLVSSIGTSRPSGGFFGAIMGGGASGKLDKRREMEEALISKSRSRYGNQALDFTIVKIGNVAPENNVKKEFALEPGDDLDGDIGIDTAAELLLQSIAYQGPARNATLSAIGTGGSTLPQSQWDDWFLRCDGPELSRIPISQNIDTSNYPQLVEYVHTWAQTKFVQASSTGLTTPVKVENTQDGVRVLFLPTNTGTRYKSKAEEREAERQNQSPSTTKAQDKTPPPQQKLRKEGGVQIVVEEIPAVFGGEVSETQLRVRAKRCAMDNDTVVKELSEEVIVKRLQDAIDYWVKEH